MDHQRNGANVIPHKRRRPAFDPFDELRAQRKLELQQQMLLSYGGGAAAFACDSADFDGTNDGLTRASALTGQTASKQCIISFWINFDNIAGGYVFFARDSTAGWNACHLTCGADLIIATNTDGVGFAYRASTTGSPFTAAAGWQHALIAWDGAAGVESIHVDDVAAAHTLNSNNNANTSWDNTDDYWVGQDQASTNRIDAQLAELYVCPGSYLDMSVTANRRKFRSATGKAVSLGSDGSTPTGTVPLVYLHLDDGESAVNFATNRTGKGNFTVVGALATGANSPTD